MRSWRSTAKKVSVRQRRCGTLATRPAPGGRPMPAGHIGLGPGLVDEYQAPRIKSALMRLPPGPAAGDRRDPVRWRAAFFKRDPLVLEKAPHRAVARRRATLGQLGHHRPQGQIRLLGDPRQQPRALARQPQRPPAPHRFGRRAAARPPALRPLHHTGHFTTLATLTPNSAAVARQVRPLATDATTRSRSPANRVLPFDAGPQPQPAS
jgi:hypothetical protein